LAIDDRKRPSNRATHALLKSKFDKVKAVREAASDALVMLTDLLVRRAWGVGPGVGVRTASDQSTCRIPRMLSVNLSARSGKLSVCWSFSGHLSQKLRLSPINDAYLQTLNLTLNPVKMAVRSCSSHVCVDGKCTLAASIPGAALEQEFVLAGVDAAAWPVFIEERTRERKLGTSVSGRILTAGAGAASPPPSTVNSAPTRPQPAPRHTDPSFIKVKGHLINPQCHTW
jgi:hypothetical protein